MPKFTVEGKIVLRGGDALKVCADDMELFILFDEGRLTVSNESGESPTVVEAYGDGTFGVVEGKVNERR